MIGEKYRNVKLFYGIRDILAIKRFFKQYFIPTRVPHYIPISIPHFIPISVPFRILSPYPFRSAFYPHIRSAFYPHIRSVPQIRSVPHPYPHFNLTRWETRILYLGNLALVFIQQSVWRCCQFSKNTALK